MSDPSLHRQALHLSTMLPEERGDALMVIALLVQLVGIMWPDVGAENEGHRSGATIVGIPRSGGDAA